MSKSAIKIDILGGIYKVNKIKKDGPTNVKKIPEKIYLIWIRFLWIRFCNLNFKIKKISLFKIIKNFINEKFIILMTL